MRPRQRYFSESCQRELEIRGSLARGNRGKIGRLDATAPPAIVRGEMESISRGNFRAEPSEICSRGVNASRLIPIPSGWPRSREFWGIPSGGRPDAATSVRATLVRRGNGYSITQPPCFLSIRAKWLPPSGCFSAWNMQEPYAIYAREICMHAARRAEHTMKIAGKYVAPLPDDQRWNYWKAVNDLFPIFYYHCICFSLNLR